MTKVSLQKLPFRESAHFTLRAELVSCTDLLLLCSLVVPNFISLITVQRSNTWFSSLLELFMLKTSHIIN